MKKYALVTTLLFSSITTSAAHSFRCENAYREKLDRINSKRVLREAGKVVNGVIVIGGGVVLVANGVGAVVGPVYGGTASVLTAITAYAGAGAEMGRLDAEPLERAWTPGIFLDRENGLKAARSVLKNLSYTKKELWQIAYDAYVKKTGIQYVDESRFKYETHMDLLLRKVNKTRVEENKDPLTYEDLRELLISMSADETFCPYKSGKNRPVTIKKMKKILDKQN